MRRTLASLLFLGVISQLIAQNNSILFDGVDDYITLNGSSSYNTYDTVTLEAWINADVWKANIWEGTIIGRDDASTGGYVLRSGANGSLDLAIGTASGWVTASTSPIMDAGVWNHVAAVIDTDVIRLYVNGVLEGSQAFTTAITPTSNNILVGESSGFAGRTFDGRIDEVRIWDTALTEAQIAANMTTDYPTGTANLIAYYKMDEINGGDSTPNEIVAANDGTLTNFTGDPLVSGYQISTEDLALASVDAPDVLTIFNNDGKVKVTVVNVGVDPIASFDVSYAIDGGGTTVTETIMQTLQAGDSYTHIFDETLMKAEGDFDLLVTVSSANDQNSANDSKTIAYAMPGGDQLRIPIFIEEQHNFAEAGQTNFADIILPDSTTNFSRITMEISVSCPSTGCDPWDQPANISVTKDGVSYEIVRYIVPFGIACGGWTVDVTDFKTILTGSTNFKSFIQVFGQSGWLLDATLIYETDEVSTPYQKFTPLWNTDYQVYGEPTVSYDLPERSVTTHPEAQEVAMRMTITGHGQGNTSNAAEFSQFTHQVAANGTVIDNHELWNPECNVNPCSPQNGTWEFPRAGWCPGSAVQPYWVDVTEAVTNNSISIDYILQEYTNEENTGYDGAGHTEPHYRIHAYLVEKSDQYIGDDPLTDLAALEITSPTLDNFNATSPIRVLLQNLGSTVITDPVLTLSINGVEVATEVASIAIDPGTTLDYTFVYSENFDIELGYDIQVRIDSENDETVSNDIVSSFVDASLGLQDASLVNVELFPNPSNGDFTISGIDLNDDITVRVSSLTGAAVYRAVLNDTATVHLSNVISTGLYFVEISKGNSRTVKKLFIK